MLFDSSLKRIGEKHQPDMSWIPTLVLKLVKNIVLLFQLGEGKGRREGRVVVLCFPVLCGPFGA